jgi:hypothetical protein
MAAYSTADPIHFCAVPAPACKKFQLLLQLVKNFWLELRPFSPYIFEKNQKFSWFQIRNFMLFKIKTIIKRFFKVKSYKQNIFKTQLQILYNKLGLFGTFYMNLHTRSRSQAQKLGLGLHQKKAATPAPQHLLPTRVIEQKPQEPHLLAELKRDPEEDAARALKATTLSAIFN